MQCSKLFSLLHRTFSSLMFCVSVSCNNSNTATKGTQEISYWLTKGDQTILFARQAPLHFGADSNQYPIIIIDTTKQYQSMIGFGYTLTGGSAELINKLPPIVKDSLLKELFSSDGIGISYLRISIGASDLSSDVFTYDDMPDGQTDPTLDKFSLKPDEKDLIPLLKEILSINPRIRIMGTPWTAPSWMKTNNNSKGGKLKNEFYPVYAKYLVKYIQSMKAENISIDAITPQNEPLNTHNNPSMEMLATEQRDFIKNHLGPAFRAADISTKIIVYDHNADRIDYPMTILSDSTAKTFIDGSAFHLYGGEIDSLTKVKEAHPDRHLYFTEQYTASNGNFGGDLSWHVKNLIVGAPRNWCRNVLEWNLAIDTSFGPHTEGGCTTCKGALTIGLTVQRNVAYYIIAHASKFVPPGSIRAESNIIDNLYNVAYVTPENKTVLIVLNDNKDFRKFTIRFNEKNLTTGLEAGAVATYIW